MAFIVADPAVPASPVTPFKTATSSPLVAIAIVISCMVTGFIPKKLGDLSRLEFLGLNDNKTADLVEGGHILARTDSGRVDGIGGSGLSGRNPSRLWNLLQNRRSCLSSHAS